LFANLRYGFACAQCEKLYSKSFFLCESDFTLRELVFFVAFRTLVLFIGRQGGHPACKKYTVETSPLSNFIIGLNVPSVTAHPYGVPSSYVPSAVLLLRAVAPTEAVKMPANLMHRHHHFNKHPAFSDFTSFQFSYRLVLIVLWNIYSILPLFYCKCIKKNYHVRAASVIIFTFTRLRFARDVSALLIDDFD